MNERQGSQLSKNFPNINEMLLAQLHTHARVHTLPPPVAPPPHFYFWTFGHRALFLLKGISLHTIAWNKSLCLKLEVDLAVYGMRVGEKGDSSKGRVAMWE